MIRNNFATTPVHRYRTMLVVLALMISVGMASIAAAGVVERPATDAFSAATMVPVQTQNALQESPTITLTDMRGRSVEIPRDIKRIIALEANSLRLLSYFDSISKVVAVEDTGHGREKTIHQFFHLATYRIAFPFLRDLPSIGSSASHEAIIAADPDLVICSIVDIGQLDQLQQKLGIPVFAINADIELGDLEQFLGQIELMGKALGEQDRSAVLVDGIKDIGDDLRSRIPVGDDNHDLDDESPSAYAGGMMYYGPADLLRTSGNYDPFDLTGVKNAMPPNPTGNKQPYMTTIEDLVVANPGYVFVDAANANLSKAGYLAQKEVLDQEVAAFRDGQVYSTLVYKYYGTNWESQIITTYYVGTVVHPERFGDVDIQAKAEEIWKLFFQVDLDYDVVATLQPPAFGQVQWL